MPINNSVTVEKWPAGRACDVREDCLDRRPMTKGQSFDWPLDTSIAPGRTRPPYPSNRSGCRKRRLYCFSTTTRPSFTWTR